jgi:ABC-2 type transport system ATP-binding protein
MNEENAIEVRGLRFGIGGKPILKGLDFSIPKGKVFAVLGHNGAGKTTFFHILLGLKYQTSGEIRILGRSNEDWRARSAIGYVVERPYLNLDHEFESLLKYHARLAGVPRKRSELERIAAEVGLAGYLGDSLGTFSKGMLQKAVLAQAALGNPEIKILDEPMSGLDPESRDSVKAQILRWRDSGKTILFSSHVLEDVEQLADEVLVLEKGEVRFRGTVSEWRARE